MQTASKRLASGESPAITGTLSCADGAAVAGQPVALYERPRAAGQRRARFVASASTRGDGSYRLAPGPLSADSFLYVRFHRLRSARVLVRVGEQVTLSGSAAGAHALDASRHSRAGAQTMTFGGIVSPASAGATVTLQSERAGHGGLWRRIGRTRVEQDGAYSITLAVKAAGETEIRAVVSDNRHHLRSMSAGVSYVISAPARPDRRRARR